MELIEIKRRIFRLARLSFTVEPELFMRVPHGTGTLLGQSQRKDRRLNFKPCGHSPLLTFL
jgi:hypothetical protein